MYYALLINQSEVSLYNQYGELTFQAHVTSLYSTYGAPPHKPLILGLAG